MWVSVGSPYEVKGKFWSSRKQVSFDLPPVCTSGPVSSGKSFANADYGLFKGGEKNEDINNIWFVSIF